MRTKVTAEGLMIPKALLRELDEVEIRRQDGGLVIMPVAAAASTDGAEDTYPIIPDDDPIYDLGKDPIDMGITDASINFDKYIY
ncbi:MAG: AbrB/MazE/SpoVT family DNA-binding domain-containing protein [Chloroflexota bacterium]|nr:AbrB/MazE/SpoVT family DNA-binding domain-containing protein [Chloroflexota bacterium]